MATADIGDDVARHDVTYRGISDAGTVEHDATAAGEDRVSVDQLVVADNTVARHCAIYQKTRRVPARCFPKLIPER